MTLSTYLPEYMRGSPIKAIRQLIWMSPIDHIKRIIKKIRNPLFWRYGFRRCQYVEKKQLFFWQWWSLNRDMKNTNECPGWQWWYWELNVWIWCWRNLRDPRTNEWKNTWGVHPMVFRSYDRFQMVRSAIDKQAYIDGKLQAIFLTKEDAEAENGHAYTPSKPA